MRVVDVELKAEERDWREVERRVREGVGSVRFGGGVGGWAEEEVGVEGREWSSSSTSGLSSSFSCSSLSCFLSGSVSDGIWDSPLKMGGYNRFPRNSRSRLRSAFTRSTC